MINQKIRKAGGGLVAAAFRSGDWSEVDRIDDIAEKDLQAVFDAVSDGTIALAWYDLPPVVTPSGSVSVLRYALSRSVKRAGCLQLSCMEMRDGDIIPTSDRQYGAGDGFRDFWRDAPNTIDFNFIF